MREFLRQLITLEDNKTASPGYFWWGAAVVAGLGLQIYCTIKQIPFDIQNYGIGVGALLSLAGLGRKLGD